MWRENISWIACKLKGNSLNTLSWLGFFERCSVFHCFCEIGAVWNCDSGPTLVSAFSRWPCPGGGSRWVAWHHHEESQLWYSSGLVSNSIISFGPFTIKDQCKKVWFLHTHNKIRACLANFRRCPETSPLGLTHNYMIFLFHFLALFFKNRETIFKNCNTALQRHGGQKTKNIESLPIR